MEKRICKYCHYSHEADGRGERVVICEPRRERRGGAGPFHIVAADGTCARFALAGRYFPKPATPPGTRRIPLSQGLYAVVDEADYDRVSRYNWCATRGRGTYYAVGTGKARNMLMHRFIMNAQPGLFVDHIDRHGLNNAFANLRFCSHSQNMQNRGPYRGSLSKYKGVWRRASNKRFNARICFEGSHYSLGAFIDEEAAARAYDKKAKELFGEFAYLNFPEE